MKRATWFLAIVLLTGCMAHSVLITKDTTDSKSLSASGQKYPPHTHQVLVLKGDLPPGMKYQVLEDVDVGSGWYGDAEVAKKLLADRARAIGADAVIQVSTWHQPAFFSWSAPHGSGHAVKLEDPRKLDPSQFPGQYF